MAQELVNGPRPVSIWLASLHSQMISTQADDPATEAAKQGKEKAIIAMLGRLALHYWRPDFTPSQAKLLYADYVRHLAPYPLKDIQESIDSYVADRESKFYPSVGQLLAPMTTRPKWDVGSNEGYAQERREIAEAEVAAIALQIGQQKLLGDVRVTP